MYQNQENLQFCSLKFINFILMTKFKINIIHLT